MASVSAASSKSKSTSAQSASKAPKPASTTSSQTSTASKTSAPASQAQSDTATISKEAKEADSGSLPVCLDAWASETLSPDRGKEVCQNPADLDNETIRGELAGMSNEELTQVRERAFDAADAHEGQMFEAMSGLDEASQADVGRSMFYGMAEQQSLLNDGENAQTADQIRERIAGLPADSAERADFQSGVLSWGEENPFYAQRGRANGAVNWAYDNYSSDLPMGTQQSMLGIVTNGNDVIGHGRVAVQTAEQQLANQ